MLTSAVRIFSPARHVRDQAWRTRRLTLGDAAGLGSEAGLGRIPGASLQGGMVSHTHIDPIEHAWRHCNPHVPLPLLVQRARPFTTERRLFSSDDQLVSEAAQPPRDVQKGLLAVAIAPLISSSDESMPDDSTDEDAAPLAGEASSS